MGAGVEIPIHEAIIFDLDAANTDSLLKQDPPSAFFVGLQFVERLLVPLELAGRGEDTFRLQDRGDSPQAAAVEVAFESPADDSGFIGIDR